MSENFTPRENFTPLLSSFDWNEEWQELQKYRRKSDDAAFWDKRAQTFGSQDSPNSYVESFLERSQIEPGESIFDMGCGNGALSIPLGKQGHSVIAGDFSPVMLEKLQSSLDELSIKNVTPLLVSWEDDWDALGLTENCVDHAFASRSIATANLKESLLRLTKVARRRACITLATEGSPRVDDRILKAVGVTTVSGYDFQYALNILINLGLQPELSYIKSSRRARFASFEEALTFFENMLEDYSERIEIGDDEIKIRLCSWLEEHLVKSSDGAENSLKPYLIDKPHSFSWAFIAWDTSRFSHT